MAQTVIHRGGDLVLYQLTALSPLHTLGSQVPLENQVNTRIKYMPLFTQRVKLCNPQTNDIKPEMNLFSTKREKSIRYEGETWPFLGTVPQSALATKVCDITGQRGLNSSLDPHFSSTCFPRSGSEFWPQKENIWRKRLPE